MKELYRYEKKSEPNVLNGALLGLGAALANQGQTPKSLSQIFYDDGLNGLLREVGRQFHEATAPLHTEITNLRGQLAKVVADRDKLAADAVRAQRMQQEFFSNTAPLMFYMGGFGGGKTYARTIIRQMEETAAKCFDSLKAETVKLKSENEGLRKAIGDLKDALTCESSSKQRELQVAREEISRLRSRVAGLNANATLRDNQIAALKKVVDQLAGTGVSSLCLDKPETFTFKQ